MKLGFGACLVIALGVLGACAGRQHRGDEMAGGAIQTGALVAPDTRTDETGVEARTFGAFDVHDPAIPNTYGFMLRDVGGDLQYAAQWGWTVGGRLGGAGVYGRLMFDIIERDEIDHASSLSAFSPTADVGIAPFGHGICVSASATWDVHFDAPDRLLVGGFVGLCGGRL